MSLEETKNRVVKTFNFEKTDRIPVFDIVQNIPFIEHYAGEKINIENGEKVLCKALGKSIDLSAEINPPAEPVVYENSGFQYKTEWWTTWLVKRPFDDVKGLKTFIKRNLHEISESDPESMWTYLGNVSYTGSDESNDVIFKHQQELCGDCMLAICESFPGLDAACHIAGFELFSYLLYEEPALISDWLNALAHHEIDRIHQVADPGLSPVTLVCCDIAYKSGTLLSHDFLKANFFPQLKGICDAWHEHDTKVIFHSDGNLFSVLDDLVETGIDGLNPLEPLEGVDVITEVRNRYPDLVLAGGIDAHQLLVNGTKEQVSDEVKRLIDNIGSGGGLFIGSTIEMHPGCRAENLIAMVETTRSYGVS